jgi:hypothetical protein
MNLAIASRAAAIGGTLLLNIATPLMADEVASRTSHVLAYVGPGAGLGFVGSLLAILAVVFLGLVGLIAYPLKMILRLRRTRPSAPAVADSHPHDPGPADKMPVCGG